mgnify:CR=1 FL=1
MAVPRFWRTITCTKGQAAALQAAFDAAYRGEGYRDMFTNTYLDDGGAEWAVASGYFTQHQLDLIDKVMARPTISLARLVGTVKQHNGEDVRGKLAEWKLKPKEQVR